MYDIVEEVCGEGIWYVSLRAEKADCGWEVVFVGGVVGCYDATGLLRS